MLQLNLNSQLSGTLCQDQLKQLRIADTWSDSVKKMSTNVKDPITSVFKVGSKMSELFYGKAENGDEDEREQQQEAQV